jgi:aromatic-amino-acid transaminase
VLLQASCHNPTGVPLSSGQWREIATIVERRGLLPLIDLAYQGLGKGLEEDVAGLRILVERVPETLIAVSCSKSFALYRERTAPYMPPPTPYPPSIAFGRIFARSHGLGACPSSHWSSWDESDSLRGYEQGLSTLED